MPRLAYGGLPMCRECHAGSDGHHPVIAYTKIALLIA